MQSHSFFERKRPSFGVIISLVMAFVLCAIVVFVNYRFGGPRLRGHLDLLSLLYALPAPVFLVLGTIVLGRGRRKLQREHRAWYKESSVWLGMAYLGLSFYSLIFSEAWGNDLIKPEVLGLLFLLYFVLTTLCCSLWSYSLQNKAKQSRLTGNGQRGQQERMERTATSHQPFRSRPQPKEIRNE